MLDYVELDIDLEKYHSDLTEYVISVYSNSNFTSTYNNLDLQDFKLHNLELTRQLELLSDSKLERVTLLVLENSSMLIHRDQGPRICRINWPILNSDSAVTVFYNKKPNAVSHAKHNGIDLYQLHDLEIRNSFILTKPTLMHVDTIHSVELIPKKPLPRIIVSFNFVNDTKLSKLLQK